MAVTYTSAVKDARLTAVVTAIGLPQASRPHGIAMARGNTSALVALEGVALVEYLVVLEPLLRVAEAVVATLVAQSKLSHLTHSLL